MIATSTLVVLVVDAEHDGERLDVALAGLMDESRSRAAGRITRGDVRVNGRVAAKSERLAAGDRIEVEPPPPTPGGADGTPVPPIRYEDEHLLVVAKPAGLVVHPGAGHPAGTLVQALAEAGIRLAPAGGDTRPGIVHRLDRGTSGLLVVAKTDEAHAGLVEAFRERRVGRRYAALAEGTLPAEGGRIEVPIGRDPANRTRFAAAADGRPAVTRWQVMAQGRTDGTVAEDVTLVACALETGRTHQVRVHLAHIGNPIVGDTTYGARQDVADAVGVRRPFLHAARLSFEHPVTGAGIDLYEPLPRELRAAARRADLEPG